MAGSFGAQDRDDTEKSCEHRAPLAFAGFVRFISLVDGLNVLGYSTQQEKAHG
jgi:hypothetical protein